MTTVLLDGRKLPHGDWEGDDFTPGARGHYFTCQDTAVGRMVAFATNGKVDRDGRVYRAAVQPPDPNGVSFQQLQPAVRKVAGKELIITDRWTWPQVLAHLKSAKGIVIDGLYSAIPRPFRYQARADFGHAIWFCYYSPASGVRGWDPLNPDTTAYGRWYPLEVVKAFSQSWGNISAYVPLDPLGG